MWSEWWTHRPQLGQACLTRQKTLSVGLPNGGVEMPCNDCQAGEEQVGLVPPAAMAAKQGRLSVT